MPRVVQNNPSSTRTCYYAHEQCSVAYEQWTRMMDRMLTSKNYLRSTCLARPQSQSSAAAAVDPGLARLVKAETTTTSSSSNWTTGRGQQMVQSQTDNADSSCPSMEELITTGTTTTIDGGDRNAMSPVCAGGGSAKEGQQREFEDVSPSSRRGLTPWKEPGKCYSRGLAGLHEEIEDFNTYMRPLPEEEFMRRDIITRLTQIVTELWSNAEVKVFGSFKTDLYLPTSDIDLVVMSDDVDSQTALKMLEQKLIEKNAYDDIKVIKTSVPIVKFTDRKTAVKVDVSFNVQTGISSADFIKNMISEYSELPYLVLVLKQFLLYRNLLESFNGGISSYCLILLIISYLQLHPEDRKTGNHGDMLIKFLELYGRHFNYLRTGIRICNGGSYFRKNENEGELGNRFSLLCIEDPFNSANDVGQGCYGAMKVREEFDKAYRELCDAVLPQYQHIQPVGSSFLGRILLLPPEVIQYRQLMREKYRDYISTPLNLDSIAAAAAVVIDDNRSDDAGSTCSQNSNMSSEQQTTKSGTTSSSSTSPGSSIPSETESDVQSDVTKHPNNQSSHIKHIPSFESNLDSTSCHVDGDLYQTYAANPPKPSVSGSVPLPQRHHQPPQPQPSSLVQELSSSGNHSHQQTTTAMTTSGGRSNSFYNTSRSQGIKSSQRSMAAARSQAAPGTAAAAPGTKTYVPSSHTNGERRPKRTARYDNSGGPGPGFMSNR